MEACGSGVTKANEHDVNTECLDISGYKRMVTVVDQHEQGHLDDFAMVVGEHDIYAAWDAMVGRSRSAVVTAAKDLADAAHAEMRRHLFRIDPRRGIEVGMEKLRANRWRVRTDLAEARARLGDAFRPKVPGFYEMCHFIGDLAPPFGTLAVVNGRPVFTFHEGADLSPWSEGRKPTREEYDALDDATNELYEAGVIDSPCPHPGYPPGASFYTKHDPPTRPRGR